MRAHLRFALAFTCALGPLAACGGAETPAVPPSATIPPFFGSPVPEQAKAAPARSGESATTFDTDSPVTMPSGTTFTAPKGWTMTNRQDATVLEDPKREVSVTFLERKEPDARLAIAAAWKHVKPDFARKERLATIIPGRGGWDAAAEIEYETTTAEARGVWANARRKGDTWYVALFDGTTDGWARRWSQANTAFLSFKAKGVVEESFRGKTAHALDEARIRELDAFAAGAVRAMKIPGAAVAIVQGGKVVLEKGYGVRELGKKDAVTPKTLFRIASMTKPLTSLLMAVLIDEGKFTWETPVTQILPTFALGDPDITKKLAVKHTVCACTGLPRQDMESVFENTEANAEKRLEVLKTMKPTTGFGETFQYSNALVAAGGYIAARALDQKKLLSPAYEDAMQTKVFGPLGMTTTTFRTETVQRSEVASPHASTARFEPAAVSFSEIASSALPAGGAWSSVRDISRYLLAELGKGKTPEGKQVVSEKNLLQRREPQVKMNDKLSYGLALSVEDDHGVKVIGHGGGNLGYSTVMFFLPEHGVGAVILTNLGGSHDWHEPFRRKLFELLFDGRDEAREDVAQALKTREEALRKEASHFDLDPERAWLERFVGTYTNPSLGKITVRMEGKQATLDAGEWKSTVGRKKEADGTVKLLLTSPGRSWIALLPKEVNGKMTLTLEVPQQKYVFEPVNGK